MSALTPTFLFLLIFAIIVDFASVIPVIGNAIASVLGLVLLAMYVLTTGQVAGKKAKKKALKRGAIRYIIDLIPVASIFTWWTPEILKLLRARPETPAQSPQDVKKQGNTSE